MRPFLLIALCSLACACAKRGDSTAPAATGPEPQAAEGSAAPATDGAEPTSQPTDGSEPSSQPTAEAEGSAAEADLVTPDPVDVARRTFAAYERLRQSDAGRILWSATEAHGGLSIWYSNGPLGFRFAYTPVDGPAIDTRQLVDTWSSRAVHQFPDSEVRFGWDGARAWVSDPAAELPTNARFWALTPYYFVGIPFVLADEGVGLELVGEMEFEGNTCDLVKATFAPGTGDAPGDHYVVLVDRESHRVRGVRYVVSYPGFFPDGGHGAEKLVTYDGSQEVDDIVFPQSYRTFAWTEDGAIGDLVTNTTLTEVTFRPSLRTIAFQVPEGATVLEGY